ncbi:MAG: YggS family pyridoxal phosphate-dependent enzyme [Bacteroidales bacterium]|nr:YggS family pyridoxal phosphate-dependent enzyme [Bacteroidales bacterium]
MVRDNIIRIRKELPPEVKLVAVSKFHPCEQIMEAYDAGQRVFGENRPQEFAAKVPLLPEDIEWHFIGHLQTNKLRLVLPYASMVESIDSCHLLDAVENWGELNDRTTDVLLELHLGAEETKGGFTEAEIEGILAREYPHVRFRGLMGMATNTDDDSVVEADFARIAAFKQRIDDRFRLPGFTELSIGMSHDWHLALRHGATIVRIGTSIFGPRNY